MTMKNTFTTFSEHKQYLLGLVHRLLFSIKRKSRLIRFVKKYLRYEVKKYKHLTESDTKEWDDVVCYGRKELAEDLLLEIKKWEHSQKRF